MVSWSSIKLNYLALSMAEAEYIAIASCTSQVRWMKSQFLDYGYRLKQISIYYDSQSAISISHNLIRHSMNKHIHIHNHCIKDHVLMVTLSLCLFHMTMKLLMSLIRH